MGILSEDMDQITAGLKCEWLVEFYGDIRTALVNPGKPMSRTMFWKDKIKEDLNNLSIDSFDGDVLKNIFKQAIHPDYFEKFELYFSNGTWFFERNFSKYGLRFGIAAQPRKIK